MTSGNTARTPPIKSTSLLNATWRASASRELIDDPADLFETTGVFDQGRTCSASTVSGNAAEVVFVEVAEVIRQFLIQSLPPFDSPRIDWTLPFRLHGRSRAISRSRRSRISW